MKHAQKKNTKQSKPNILKRLNHILESQKQIDIEDAALFETQAFPNRTRFTDTA